MVFDLYQHLFWPPDRKTWLIGKDPDAGKDWGQEENGATEDEIVEWHRWLNGYEFGQTQELVKDREASVHGSRRVGHDWETEQQKQPIKENLMG